MDITEFFQQSAGKWFSQRTSHDLALKQTESGKSNLQIEMLDKNDPDVIYLCQLHQVDAALALCGVRVTWDGTVERDEGKHAGSMVVVPLADLSQPNAGRLLRGTGAATAVGRYAIGADDALTLITEDETLYSEERLWFASPNLRLRTSTLKRLDGFSMASFCSEIRMGVTQPPATADAAASAS